jgi:hypothetical protein
MSAQWEEPALGEEAGSEDVNQIDYNTFDRRPRCKRCGLDKIFLGEDGLCEECTWEDAQGVAPFADQTASSNTGEVVDVPTSTGLGALTRSAAMERIAKTPTAWVVEGIIRSTDYGALVGSKGAGKTLAELDMAASVTLGEPWLGRFSTVRGRVLVLTCEESEAQIWQRIDAICRSKRHDPEELEDKLYVHPLPFSVISDLERLRLELSLFDDLALVVLDPAYKYMAGANTKAIFDMGVVLTPLQMVCQERGAALVVGHHYNRREGAAREDRVSGAGLHEWGRFLITIEKKKSNDEMETVRLEISGNSIGESGLTLRRSVLPLDDSPNPELSYYVEITSEGSEESSQPWTAERRLDDLLPDDPAEGLLVAEVQDGTKNDKSGLGPMKMDTVSRTLRRLREDGRADTDGEVGKPGRWWKV